MTENSCFPRRIDGRVVHGKGKGRTVGMPTVNLVPETGTVLPAPGVYATLVYIGKETRIGVTNVGTRPSVDDDRKITVETLILDFRNDIYGERIGLEFYYFLRPVKKMESLEAVRLQVEKDSLRARKYFSQKGIDPDYGQSSGH